jgi:hypothetical protein
MASPAAIGLGGEEGGEDQNDDVGLDPHLLQ